MNKKSPKNFFKFNKGSIEASGASATLFVIAIIIAVILRFLASLSFGH